MYFFLNKFITWHLSAPRCFHIFDEFYFHLCCSFFSSVKTVGAPAFVSAVLWNQQQHSETWRRRGLNVWMFQWRFHAAVVSQKDSHRRFDRFVNASAASRDHERPEEVKLVNSFDLSLSVTRNFNLHHIHWAWRCVQRKGHRLIQIKISELRDVLRNMIAHFWTLWTAYCSLSTVD